MPFKYFTKLLIVFCFLALGVSNSSKAAHMYGGNISYIYVTDTVVFGQTRHLYQIVMTVYYDCNDNRYPFRNPETISIYEGPLNASSLPLSSRVANVQVTFLDSTTLSPNLPPGCAVQSNVCVGKIRYGGQVLLPSTFTGYHFVWDRCCRQVLTNISGAVNTVGSVFHSWTATTATKNSSPVFRDLKQPFLCAGQSKSIVNLALDIDGNQLNYEFYHPFDGEATRGNVTHSNGYTNWPPSLVTYDSSYSLTAPFGPTGNASINGVTGLATIKAPSITGEFVVGVKVKEIDKNGFTIGVVHREFQFPVIACNDTNTFTPSLIQGSKTDFTLEAGDSLCFDIEFESKGANLGFEHEVIGEPFLPPTNPQATLGAIQLNGKKSKQRVCWNTTCAQARSNKYFFTATMADSACLPGDTNIVFGITVKPFEGPQKINGNKTLCTGAQGEIYSTDTIQGATYSWSVTGGTIVGPTNGTSVTVNWGTGSGGTIQVQSASRFGCPGTPVVESILLSAFDVRPGSDRTICLGDTTTLGSVSSLPTAPQGYSIKWSPSSNLDNDTAQNPNAFPTTTTTYTITVTDTSGLCTVVDSVTVTVLQNTNAGISTNDTTICEGNQVQLQAFGGRFYKWSPSTGVSNDTIINPTTTISSTTTFFCTISDTGSTCPKIDSVTVTVDRKDQISAGSDSSICLNESYMLGQTPNGPSGSKYLWTPNTGLSNDTLPNPVYTPTSAGSIQFVLRVTTPANCVFFDTVSVRTDTIPTLIINVTSDTICKGEIDSIFVRGAVNYTWIPATLPQNQSFQFVTPDSTSTYYVTGTDGNICSNTDSVTIVVNPIPEITIPHDSIFLCRGDSVQLTTTAGANRYKWTPNTAISPHDSAANPFVKPTSSIRYKVQIDGLGNCSASDSIFVLVSDSVPTDAGAPQTICFPDTVQIGGSPTALPFNTSFTWVPGSTLNDSTLSNPNAFNSQTQTYVVVARNGRCIGFDSVTVTVSPKPTLSYTKSTYEICKGDSVRLDTNGLSGSISSFSWNPSDRLSDTNSVTPFAFPDSSTSYTINFSDALGCSGSTTLRVNVTDKANIFAGNDTNACEGNAIQLRATGGVKYLWSPGNVLDDSTSATPLATISTNTTFVVSGENALGCKGSDTVTVNVVAAPRIDAGGTFVTCSDTVNSIRLGGNPTGPANATYSWSGADVLDDPSSPNPITSFTLAKTYILLVQDTNGCVSVDSALVRPFSFRVNSPSADCNGDSIQLNVSEITGKAPFSYRWSPNYKLSSDTIANPISTTDSSMTYVVVVTDSNGCVDSAQSLVNLENIVKAQFSVNVSANCDNAVAATQNESTNATDFIWYLNGTSYSTAYDVEFELPFNQSIAIDLVATNPAVGCSDTSKYSQQVLSFEDYFTAEIPNVFTPNDDGINDKFDVQLGNRLENCANIKIYNRWGVLVYESRENDHTWDGRTFTGDKCKEGVYFFILDINGSLYKGEVTLLRD